MPHSKKANVLKAVAELDLSAQDRTESFRRRFSVKFSAHFTANRMRKLSAVYKRPSRGGNRVEFGGITEHPCRHVVRQRIEIFEDDVRVMLDTHPCPSVQDLPRVPAGEKIRYNDLENFEQVFPAAMRVTRAAIRCSMMANRPELSRIGFSMAAPKIIQKGEVGSVVLTGFRFQVLDKKDEKLFDIILDETNVSGRDRNAGKVFITLERPIPVRATVGDLVKQIEIMYRVMRELGNGNQPETQNNS